jgi:desampylase
MRSVLRLSANAFEAIRRAAAATPDLEICGLLVEEYGLAEAFLTPNRHPEPAHGFAICDRFHARIQRSARGRGARVIGCFHSHPSGETAPSQMDLLAASEDGFIWLICAPDGRMQAWRARVGPRTKSFDSIDLELAAHPQSAIAAEARAT